MQLTKSGKSCSAVPTGFLDEPKDHASAGTVLNIRGWVYATAPLKDVTVYLDGAAVKSFYPALPRPDVDEKYPGGTVKNKGWQSTLDLSKLPPGSHSIEVHAELKDGCEAVLGVSNITEVR